MPAPARVLSHLDRLLCGLPLVAVCACQGSRGGADVVETDAADPVAVAQEAAVDGAGTHGEAGATSDAAIQSLPCQFGSTSAGEFEVCIAAPDAAMPADAATDAASLDAITPASTDAATSDASPPRDAASDAASADASCSAGSVDAEPLDSLLVVFDPSSAADLPFAGGLTRYQATRRALFDPSQGVLTQVQARLFLGAAASHAIDTPSCAQEMLGSDFMQALPQNAGRVEQAMLTLSTSGNMGTTDVAAAIGFALSSAQTNWYHPPRVTPGSPRRPRGDPKPARHVRRA